MYNAFGKCKNFNSVAIYGRADCRNCSHQNPSGTNEFKVGDWCKNYSTYARKKQRTELITAKPKLIIKKDFNARRI